MLVSVSRGRAPPPAAVRAGDWHGQRAPAIDVPVAGGVERLRGTRAVEAAQEPDDCLRAGAADLRALRTPEWDASDNGGEARVSVTEAVGRSG